MRAHERKSTLNYRRFAGSNFVKILKCCYPITKMEGPDFFLNHHNARKMGNPLEEQVLREYQGAVRQRPRQRKTRQDQAWFGRVRSAVLGVYFRGGRRAECGCSFGPGVVRITICSCVRIGPEGVSVQFILLMERIRFLCFDLNPSRQNANRILTKRRARFSECGSAPCRRLKT